MPPHYLGLIVKRPLCILMESASTWVHRWFLQSPSEHDKGSRRRYHTHYINCVHIKQFIIGHKVNSSCVWVAMLTFTGHTWPSSAAKLSQAFCLCLADSLLSLQLFFFYFLFFIFYSSWRSGCCMVECTLLTSVPSPEYLHPTPTRFDKL